jgi:hypothetical protein
VDPELARKNVLAGIALFAIFLVIFAGTFVIGLVYLALD